MNRALELQRALTDAEARGAGRELGRAQQEVCVLTDGVMCIRGGLLLAVEFFFVYVKLIDSCRCCSIQRLPPQLAALRGRMAAVGLVEDQLLEAKVCTPRIIRYGSTHPTLTFAATRSTLNYLSPSPPTLYRRHTNW